MACITHFSGHPERTERGQDAVDVSGSEINDVDLVSRLSQPGGVDAGASADIGDPRRRRREVAPQHFLGA
jgi:hypothetical protein